MSIARAFTKRTKRPEISLPTTAAPGRTVSVRRPDGKFERAQISAPVQLISTTNILALEAPDIHPKKTSPTSAPWTPQLVNSSSASSITSSDSDAGCRSVSGSSTASRETATDASSVESSPSPLEPNHLSCYFKSATNVNVTEKSRSNSTSTVVSEGHEETAGEPALTSTPAPAVPMRALTHTKKNHQALARKRSQRLSPQADLLQIGATAIFRSSIDIFSSNKPTNAPVASVVDNANPFSAELEQVKELAEEFAPKGDRGEPIILDDEEQFLFTHGLSKFRAEDYAAEIQGLFGGVFDEPVRPAGEGWF